MVLAAVERLVRNHSIVTPFPPRAWGSISMQGTPIPWLGVTWEDMWIWGDPNYTHRVHSISIPLAPNVSWETASEREGLCSPK